MPVILCVCVGCERGGLASAGISKWSEVAQLCPTLCNSMDSSLHQSSPSMGFSRQEYWSGLPFPSPGNLPDPGIEPVSHTVGRCSTVWATREVLSRVSLKGHSKVASANVGKAANWIQCSLQEGTVSAGVRPVWFSQELQAHRKQIGRSKSLLPSPALQSP